jgi:hypothetical protein
MPILQSERASLSVSDDLGLSQPMVRIAVCCALTA